MTKISAVLIAATFAILCGCAPLATNSGPWDSTSVSGSWPSSANETAGPKTR